MLNPNQDQKQTTPAIADEVRPKRRGNPNPKLKGAQANPNGRPPKKWTWEKLLVDALNRSYKIKKMEIGKNGNRPREVILQAKKEIINQIVKQSMEGKKDFIELLMNRTEGMPKQTIKMENNELDEVKNLLKQKLKPL